MVQNKPFVKIPYDILTHNVWELSPLHKATLFELFLRVNWKDGKSRNIDVKRAQLPCSYQWLADRVGVCRTKMVHILEDLEAIGAITKTSKNRSHLMITLELFYGSGEAATSTQTSMPSNTQSSIPNTLVCKTEKINTQTSEQTSTRGELSIIIEEQKKEESGVASAPTHTPPENEKPAKKSTRFVRPTVEEVFEYCKERCNLVDPQRFVDYYESNGWRVGKNPMKDWKACVRIWEKKDGFKAQPQITDANKTQQPSLFDAPQSQLKSQQQTYAPWSEILEKKSTYGLLRFNETNLNDATRRAIAAIGGWVALCQSSERELSFKSVQYNKIVRGA